MKKYGGKLVFEGSDSTGVVEVVDREKVRTLHFGNATEQSSMYLEQPFGLEMEYIRTMALALVFKAKVRKALCLGLGGGALPKFIWKYFPDCEVEAVEFSPLVIDVAHRYFHLPDDKRLRVKCEDALRFLRGGKGDNDLLFVDLYIDSGSAPEVAEEDFFTRCDLWLRPGGILVWNMWRNSTQALNNLKAIFGTKFAILPNQESANSAVLAFKEPVETFTAKQLEEEAIKLQKLTHTDFPKILKGI